MVLPASQRQAYSFLCQGPNQLHGPLAISVVDPTVVPLDMDNAPADRWHGVVDMVDDMIGAVRRDLKAKKLTKVRTCSA